MKKVSFAGPRVGTVVMMRAVGDASAMEDAFTAAHHTALADTLRAKGYEPVELYSGVFREGIGALGAFKQLRALRPMLKQPVFDNPAVREVAGVVVAWVEFKLKIPSYSVDGLGKRTTVEGNIPAPAGQLFIEIFSPEGEPLVWANRPFWEWGTIETVSGSGKEPSVQSAGPYRVLSPEEIALTEVKSALYLLRSYEAH